MVKKIKDLWIKYQEIIMYLIFGVLTTIVSWGSYALLTQVMKSMPSKIISWFLSVLFAYLTNKVWVFGSRDWSFAFITKEVFLFYAARAISGVVEIGGFWVLVHLCGLDQPLFGIDEFLANVIISVFVVILNYILSKVMIFRKKKKE